MTSEKCTIYLLRNLVNDKVYVGQTWEFPVEKRMGKDGSQYSNSPYIYNAIRKYGVNNFKYTVLAKCNTQEQADLLENENITKYDSRNPEIGYNLKEGGSHGKHSEETKNKISSSIKNKVWSPEALEGKARAGSMWKGKKRGPHTDERKEHNSKLMIEHHKNDGHPMQGQHHTEEVKQKISKSLKGRKIPRESIKRGALARRMPVEKEQGIIKAYQEGVPISSIGVIFDTKSSSIYRVLHRNGIVIERPHDTWSGKNHSQETRDKMSVARSLFWSEHNRHKNR